jgi:hypothetical protein
LDIDQTRLDIDQTRLDIEQTRLDIAVNDVADDDDDCHVPTTNQPNLMRRDWAIHRGIHMNTMPREDSIMSSPDKGPNQNSSLT